MEIRNGQVVRYEGDPMVVEETAAQPIAVAVKNGGEWFNPPRTHLDQAVNSHHPVYLAELGLRFYSDLLAEVANRFFAADPAAKCR